MTATSSSSSPAFTLSGLDPAETYTVEVAFDSNFTISKQSATFNTPGISSITAGSITHNSATVSVTVSNPNSTAVYLQYKQDDECVVVDSKHGLADGNGYGRDCRVRAERPLPLHRLRRARVVRECLPIR